MRRERVVGAVLQRLVERELVGREHQQPGHRDREVAVRQLDELHVAEVALVAQVGEVVLVAALPSTSPA